jgi:hypothetical protein
VAWLARPWLALMPVDAGEHCAAHGQGGEAVAPIGQRGSDVLVREAAGAGPVPGNGTAGQAVSLAWTCCGLTRIGVNMRQDVHGRWISPFLIPFSLTEMVRLPHQNANHGGMMVGVARYFA